MNWHVVYDIRDMGTGDLAVFLFIAAALLATALGFHVAARRKATHPTTARILIAVAVLFAGLGYGMNAWDRSRLAARLDAGEVQTVEGPVVGHQIWREDITNPGRDSSRRYRNWETITVGPVTFVWAPGAEEAAFTNRMDPPLAFQDGTAVRVSWVEDAPEQAHQRRIVKLEMAGDLALQGSPGLPAAPFPSVAPVEAP